MTKNDTKGSKLAKTGRLNFVIGISSSGGGGGGPHYINPWRRGVTPPGKKKRERIVVVVGSPCQENYPADAHPSAHKSVLESANPGMDSEGASGCTRSTARAPAPSPGRPTPGVVKQDQSSGGSVDTTKTRWGPQRVRMSSGEGPTGATKGTQPNTEALCQPPGPK